MLFEKDEEKENTEKKTLHIKCTLGVLNRGTF